MATDQELDPLWLNRVSKLSAKSWKSLVAKDKEQIKLHRRDIHALAGETGLEIGEFRGMNANARDTQRNALFVTACAERLGVLVKSQSTGNRANGMVGLLIPFVRCSPIKSSAEWEGAASEPCRVSNVR